MTGCDAVVGLSVVIPAFDEAGRIGSTVAAVCSFLERQPDTWELVVVLDGGRPGAAEEIAAAAGGRSNVQVLDNGVNRGKGYSVRRGMLAARGSSRVFIDADLSLPIEAVGAVVAGLRDGSDVVIGSRTAPGATVAGPGATTRRIVGAAFNLVVRALAVSSLRDTQCGLKGFSAAAARRIFERQRLDRFGFDVELLFLAQRYGMRIAELPVRCTYHGGSSVRRFSDALAMVADVARVRWNAALGRYGA